MFGRRDTCPYIFIGWRRDTEWIEERGVLYGPEIALGVYFNNDSRNIHESRFRTEYLRPERLPSSNVKLSKSVCRYFTLEKSFAFKNIDRFVKKNCDRKIRWVLF